MSRARFTDEFEREAVAQAKERSYSVKDVSDRLGSCMMFYNPKRKHTNNGILSPVAYEKQQRVKMQGI